MEHYWMFGKFLLLFIVVLSVDLSVFIGKVSDNEEPFWILEKLTVWHLISFRIYTGLFN